MSKIDRNLTNVSWLIVGCCALGISITESWAQRDRQNRGSSTGTQGQRQGSRQTSPRTTTSRTQTSGPPVHARRDDVRTQSYVPRPNANQNDQGRNPGRRPGNPSMNSNPGRYPGNNNQGSFRPDTSRLGSFGGQRRGVGNGWPVQNQRSFTRTQQGRQYDNGVRLNRGLRVTSSWQRPYFPSGYAHFNHYRPSYNSGSVFISPFGFYFGVGDPFLDSSYFRVSAPSRGYIDRPIYSGNRWTSWSFDDGENLFDQPDWTTSEPGLSRAIDELTETFQNGNIDALVALIDPNTSIAIYLQGSYKYSMASNDYVNVTRDAIRSIRTDRFEITRLEQKAAGIYSATGKQTYRDNYGDIHTVYVSYVLKDINGQWTLTQVGTSPDTIRRW